MVGIRFKNMSRKKRKEILKVCNLQYDNVYRKTFPCLPKNIKDLSSDNIKMISVMEGITGKRGLLVELLRLKKTFDGVQ